MSAPARMYQVGEYVQQAGGGPRQQVVSTSLDNRYWLEWPPGTTRAQGPFRADQLRPTPTLQQRAPTPPPDPHAIAHFYEMRSAPAPPTAQELQRMELDRMRIELEATRLAAHLREQAAQTERDAVVASAAAFKAQLGVVTDAASRQAHQEAARVAAQAQFKQAIEQARADPYPDHAMYAYRASVHAPLQMANRMIGWPLRELPPPSSPYALKLSQEAARDYMRKFKGIAYNRTRALMDLGYLVAYALTGPTASVAYNRLKRLVCVAEVHGDVVHMIHTDDKPVDPADAARTVADINAAFYKHIHSAVPWAQRWNAIQYLEL